MDDPAALYEEGRKAWPQIAVEAARFEAHVSAVAGPSPSPLRGGDLYLACALAGSDPAAIAAFERHYLAAARRLLRSRGFAGDEVDEVCQQLRVKLIVGPPPRILSYRGHGSLLRWLLVSALRDAVKQRRRVRPAGDSVDQLVDELVADARPDVDSMKHGYRAAFREAFAAAVGALSPRERTVLKLHTIERLRLEDIASLYGAHRATVARWLQKIRERLGAGTREHLAIELGASLGEVEDVLGLIASRLDASVERLLAD